MGCMCASERFQGEKKAVEESPAEGKKPAKHADSLSSARPDKSALSRQRSSVSDINEKFRRCRLFHPIVESIDSYFAKVSTLKDNRTSALELRCYPNSHTQCCVFSVPRNQNENLYDELTKLQPVAETRSLLDHCYVLHPFGVYYNDRRFYTITEVFTGVLKDYLGVRKLLNERAIVTITKQILLALNYCHQQKITHGSLNLNSIVLMQPLETNEVHVKLTGFCSLDTVPNDEEKPGAADWMFIAPESVNGTFSTASDVWSCGAILYALITGESPHSRVPKKSAISKLKKAQVLYSADLWEKYSPSAFVLVSSMLKWFPETRPSVVECLQHLWFSTMYRQPDVRPERLLTHLHRLLSSMKMNALQETLLKFIVTRIMSHSSLSEYRAVFELIDTAQDGVISSTELAEWVGNMLPGEHTEATTQKLMSLLDVDNSGEISYTEFLLGCISNKTVLTDQHLEEAFLCMDRDGSGTVTLDELQQFFWKKVQTADRKWKHLVDQASRSQDGKVYLSDMRKLVLGSA